MLSLLVSDGPPWLGKYCAAIPLISLTSASGGIATGAPMIACLSRAGGCTFPEDPGLDCTLAAPMWSAAVDPCVLFVLAEPASTACVDLSALSAVTVRCDGVDHVRLVLRDTVFRLDVRQGSIRQPCRITYFLVPSAQLPCQLETVRRLHSCLSGMPFRADPDPAAARLHRLATALRVWDARTAGLSLRQTADEVWGPGEWPGAGEHRKSAVRRYIRLGEALVAGGPAAVLAREWRS